MRAVLSELGVESSPALELLIRRAWQVHQRREVDANAVSRSTILYAAATISPLVLAVLETHGLNMRAWERALGLEERPKFQGGGGETNYRVNAETTIPALADYVQAHGNRPLDAVGVTQAFFATISWDALEHLQFAGVDIDTAKQRFDHLVEASPQGWIEPWRLEYPLSGLAAATLESAQRLAQSHGVLYPALTASEVLIGAARVEQAARPTAPDFFRSLISEVAGERFDAAVKEWMEWYDTGATTENSYELWSQPLTAIVERALHLAQQTNTVPEAPVAISARHLIGALIASNRWAANCGIPEFLKTAGIDQRGLARAYFKYLSEAPTDFGGLRDNMEVWRSFLGLGAQSYVPRFNAEDVAGGDLLNVSPNVNAFASLLASNKIEPPLSIGLFGDWGSGKSFFMAKMREEIAERASRARQSDDSVFHPRIVQIEFNAWHYVEANLWASMVEHLFRNLKLTYEKPDEKSVGERREELLKKLDKLMEERIQAEERVQKAENARERAAQELEAKKKAVDARAAVARDMRAKDVWELVTIGDDEKKELQGHLRELGVSGVLASTEDVRKTVDELRSVKTRSSLLANWIVRQPRSLRLLVVLMMLAPFAAAGVTALIDLISKGVYTDVAKTLSQVAAFVTAAAMWVGKGLAGGQKILDRIDAARDKIDAKVAKKEKELQGRVDEAEAALKQAAGEVATAQEAVVKNEEEVAKAKQKLLELTSGYRLNRFIDERAASDDYRKLLGVLATVRSDFSMLSELMYPLEPQAKLKDELRIDRIILYIDDLDRCEPERVIEVLQAVHLLLAFKLFVVVVGVDARWVSESLRQKHRALRGRNGRQLEEEDNGVPGFAVEPHDYLEKIFQVPFWLDPLKPKTAASYIANLLAGDLEKVEQKRDEPRPPADVVPGEPASSGEHHELSMTQHTIGEDEDEETDPKQLTIDDKELKYMQREELASLVSRSPRTAKRFVNTYRFLRASIPREELDVYLNGAYRRALLMLAIVVGAPDTSLEVFEQMRAAAKDTPLPDFAKNLKRTENHQAEWDRVAAALAKFGHEENVTAGDLTGQIDRVSRYSFRPPFAQLTKKQTPKPEYLVRIRRDQNAGPASAGPVI